ncbi:MAG: transglutaminase family protein, partial [Oligoflexia bacterium]|nr:transglutaminase family protein [Oligoflexia bacterium]
INFVMSALIDKIRYMRDWRSINGGYIPRSLSVIVKTGFGDCKDMSISLSALLRQLGFKAQVALVFRNSTRHSSDDYTLPNKGAFNHAIVRATVKDKVFWLDPTNFSVYSRGVFSDIANRPALVLEQPVSKVLRTPKLYGSESMLYLSQSLGLTKNDLLKAKGTINFKGRAAIPYTGAMLNTSKKSLDYDFINFGGDVSTLKKWKVGNYDLRSRIVKDFSVKISYVAQADNPSSGYKSQLGALFFFPYPSAVRVFFIRAINRVSDLFLGQPRKIIFISKLKNIKPVENLNFDCQLRSKWLSADRSVESTDPLVIKDSYEFKTAEVSIKEIKSKEFLKLQKELNSCFLRFAMIYKKSH